MGFRSNEYHTVKCDIKGCEETMSLLKLDRGRRAVREFFKEMGWYIKGYTAYCPKHGGR